MISLKDMTETLKDHEGLFFEGPKKTSPKEQGNVPVETHIWQ